MSNKDKINQAFARFDEANGEDPNMDMANGSAVPKELLYSHRMSEWLERISPDASIPLRLAARAQHICRWKSPRSSYPMDRIGYLKWRTELKKFHAETAGRILEEVGFEPELIERTQTLIRKENLATDPETQVLEDVICLVFLENYFADFSQAHDPAKVIDIVRKTWKKMSNSGHQAALALNYTPAALELIKEALRA